VTSGDDLTDTKDPFKVAMRQIAGAFAQLEKARLVAKLRHARERRRAEGHRVEGRRPLAETHPEAVALAKRLRRANPKSGERRSLRKISAELAAAGFVNTKGKPFNAKSVLAMIEGPVPAKREENQQ
jgi:DNA invertase Pin-like site-specific DNA recombinase